MTSIMSSLCCCGSSPACDRKRDFSVSMEYRFTCETWYRTSNIVVPFATAPECGPSEFPGCSTPSVPCSAPALGGCSHTFSAPTQLCDAAGTEEHFITSLLMSTWTVTVPYVSTGSEPASSSSGCTWYGDPGTGLAPSGLSYGGVREVDTNSIVLKYDLIPCGGCANGYTLTPNVSGAYTKTLTVEYGHRCVYGPPPYFMVLQRAVNVIYLNWTYEITGGFFITKNAAGVTQNTLDLSLHTMASAVTAINAWAETIATTPWGAAAAAGWPATMWVDRAAALIPTPFAGDVYLFLSGTVEHYQDGIMGPYWKSNAVFPLKVGCGTACDYEGGTDDKAELQFCQGIGTNWCDYETSYNPTAPVGEQNFNDFCYGPNFTTGYFSCDQNDGSLTWITGTACTSGNLPAGGVDLGGFGDRAMVIGTQLALSSDDPGTWSPTYCIETIGTPSCDSCECPDTFADPQVVQYGKSCSVYEQLNGWRLFKYFSVTRL